MTQANDQPSDRERSVDRQFRILDRRISRLEDTQVTWRELNDAFDRVYEEIDELKVEMNQRFDAQDTKIDNLGIELNGKLDLILRRLTGMGQGNE